MKRSFILAGLLMGTAVTSTAIYPAVSQTVGINSAVRNIVKTKENASAAARQAQTKQRVTLGNEIATMLASGLQILLLDRSALTLGPNARLTVDRFVYDPARRASSLGASIAKGAFRFLSGKAVGRGTSQTSLNTPAATIGIRGTIVEGAVGEDAVAIARGETGMQFPAQFDPETASLIVLRGPGVNALMGEKPGQIDVSSGGQMITLDGSGQAVFAPGPGLPLVGPFSLSDAGYKSFDSALRTAPGVAAASSATSTGGAGAGTSAGAGAGGASLGLIGAGIAAVAGIIAVVASSGGGAETPRSPS